MGGLYLDATRNQDVAFFRLIMITEFPSHSSSLANPLLVVEESTPDGGEVFVEGLPVSLSFGKRSKGVSWYHYGRTGTGKRSGTWTPSSILLYRSDIAIFTVTPLPRALLSQPAADGFSPRHASRAG